MDLDESAVIPWEWLISRICEEFRCLPSQAVEELLDDNEDLVLTIMEFRAYAQTKQQLDNAKRPEDAPVGPMLARVFQVQNEILERKKRG